MATTVNQLLTLALKGAGVTGTGQAASAEDINDAFTLCNYMLGEWAFQRWFIWHLVEYTKTSTGANSYTVGPTGDFVVPQIPNTVDDAFLRQIVNSTPNQVDFPLKIITAREDYNRIALKQLGSFSRYLFYDYNFEGGNGVVYPWPVPQASIYELHIFVKAQLSQFTSLSQTINLPLEYNSCLHYNMVQRLKAAYQMEADVRIDKLAASTLDVVKNANAQMPTLTVPVDVTRQAIYDIYSDQVY